MAYADGELDAADAPEIEAAMAADPQVAQRSRATARRCAREVGGAFAGVLEEPVPGSIAARGHESRKALPQRRTWSWPEWTSIAASLLSGSSSAARCSAVRAGRRDHRDGHRRAHRCRRTAGAGALGAAQLGGQLRRPHRADASAASLASTAGPSARESSRTWSASRAATPRPGASTCSRRSRPRKPAATIEWRAHSCRRPSSRPSRNGCRARRSMPTKKPLRASDAGGTAHEMENEAQRA